MTTFDHRSDHNVIWILGDSSDVVAQMVDDRDIDRSIICVWKMIPQDSRVEAELHEELKRTQAGLVAVLANWLSKREADARTEGGTSAVEG